MEVNITESTKKLYNHVIKRPRIATSCEKELINPSNTLKTLESTLFVVSVANPKVYNIYTTTSVSNPYHYLDANVSPGNVITGVPVHKTSMDVVWPLHSGVSKHTSAN